MAGKSWHLICLQGLDNFWQDLEGLSTSKKPLKSTSTYPCIRFRRIRQSSQDTCYSAHTRSSTFPFYTYKVCMPDTDLPLWYKSMGVIIFIKHWLNRKGCPLPFCIIHRLVLFSQILTKNNQLFIKKVGQWSALVYIHVKGQHLSLIIPSQIPTAVLCKILW